MARIPAPTPIDKDSVLAFLKSDHAGEILRLMIFETAPLAHLFRDAGAEIPRRVEDEQVYIFRWLLSLAVQHGDTWPSYAQARIDAAKAVLTAKSGEPS